VSIGNEVPEGSARTGLGGYPGRGIHGEIVRALGQRVVSGAVRPGEVLDVERLETELDVSRTVIREALKVLTAKGLVDARPRRGTYVRPRAQWNLLDTDVLRWQRATQTGGTFLANLAEVRAIVEPAAARLAARRRTDGDLERLREALAAMAAHPDDRDAVIAADLLFHRGLLAAAHNELLDQLEVVIETGLRARDDLVHRGSGWADPVPTHNAVYEAVRDGDADAAELAMFALLSQAVRDVTPLTEPDAAP